MNEHVITTAGEAPAPAPVVDPETEISFSLVHIFLDLPRRISAILDGSGRSALQLVQVGKDVRETVEGWSYIFTGAQVDPVMAGVRSCYSLARFDVEKFDHRSGGIYRRADWQQQCMSCTTSLEPIRKYEFDEIYRETDGDPDPRQRCPECGAKMTGFPVVEPRLPDQHYRRTVDEVRRCMRTPNETYEWVLPRVYGMFLGRDAGRLRDNPSMNWAPGSTDECAMMQDLCSKYQAPMVRPYSMASYAAVKGFRPAMWLMLCRPVCCGWVPSESLVEKKSNQQQMNGIPRGWAIDLA